MAEFESCLCHHCHPQAPAPRYEEVPSRDALVHAVEGALAAYNEQASVAA